MSDPAAAVWDSSEPNPSPAALRQGGITAPIELLADQVRDLYSAEEQVSVTLPELATLAYQPDLRAFLAGQGERAALQKNRLSRVADLLESQPGGDPCKAMEGLIKGGNRHVAMAEGSVVTDLILIAHVKRMHHYQIAGYDFALGLAECLHLPRAMFSLSISLKEEYDASRSLTQLATTIFNAIGEGASN